MIEPAGHRILVRPDKIDEKEGAIWIPPEARQKMGDAQIFGEVVKVGMTAFKDFGETPWCKVGDKVAFAKYGGFFLQDPDTKEVFRLLNDEDICAIIIEEKGDE